MAAADGNAAGPVGAFGGLVEEKAQPQHAGGDIGIGAYSHADQQRGGCDHADDDRHAAAPAQPDPAALKVAEPAAQRRASAGADPLSRGEKTGFLLGKAPDRHQVVKAPGEHQVENEIHAGIAEGEQQHIAVFQYPQPGRLPFHRVVLAVVGSDQGDLSGVDRTVLRRIVARIPPPQRRAEKTEGRQDDEGATPAELAHQPWQQRGGDRQAHGETGTGQAGRKSPATDREPALDADIDHRKNRRMHHADTELHRHQGHQNQRTRRRIAARHQAGDDDQHGPGQRNQGQHLARPEAIAQQSAGKLEQRIAERKRRHHPAPLDFRQLQIGHHAGCGDGKVAAQHVGNETDEHQDGDDAPAHVGGPRQRGGWRRDINYRHEEVSLLIIVIRQP